MSKRSKTSRTGRRKFFRKVALAGGAAGIALASRGALGQAVSEEENSPVQPASKGYHETAHIAEYYDKARF